MSTWPTKVLSELCRPRQWPTLSKADLLPAGLPVYGANGVIGYTDKPTHCDETILIGCRGSCGTVHRLKPPAYANGNAMALDELQTDLVDLNFLEHFLRQRGFADVTTGASQPQIVQRNLNGIEIPLPPLKEQKRIGAILDRADDLHRKRKRAIDQLNLLGQAIFHDMFGDPIANPKGWPIAELQTLIDPQRPVTYGILKPGPDIEGGIPYVRVVDIKNDQVVVEQLRRTTPKIAKEYRRSTLRTGDLLISIRGHVGRMAVVPFECDLANITQDTARLAISGAETVFVKFALATPTVRHWMEQRTRGMAVRGINLGDLRKVPIITPPVDQQIEFVGLVSQVERQILASVSQLHAATSLFRSLQYRAFRGEL